MLDLVAIMRTLAWKRTIFNSDADFQLAIGWETQLARGPHAAFGSYRPLQAASSFDII